MADPLKALVHAPVVQATLLASGLYTLYQLSRPGTIISWPALAVLVVTWALVALLVSKLTRQTGPGTAFLAGAAASLTGAFMATFFKTSITLPPLSGLLSQATLIGAFTVLADEVLNKMRRLA